MTAAMARQSTPCSRSALHISLLLARSQCRTRHSGFVIDVAPAKVFARDGRYTGASRASSNEIASPAATSRKSKFRPIDVDYPIELRLPRAGLLNCNQRPQPLDFLQHGQYAVAHRARHVKAADEETARRWYEPALSRKRVDVFLYHARVIEGLEIKEIRGRLR